MITVSVMYPRRDGARFDMDYYCGTHMKMVRELGGSRVQRIVVERGVGGNDNAPPYAVIGRIYVGSIEDWQAVIKEHGRAFMADLPNFTDIEPRIQVSEVAAEL